MDGTDPATEPARFTDDGLAAIAAAPDPFAGLDVATIRAMTEARAAGRPRGPAMDEVHDLTVGGCPARFYRPRPGPRPLVVYLHGGGWTIGSVATFDRAVRRLAARSGAAVLSLDYRRAPEDPWPAAVDDAVAALRWAARGAPGAPGPAPTRVVVAGDSAGGTLAALACLRLRDEEPRSLPVLQALLYANVDLSGAGNEPSLTEKAEGFALTAASVEHFAGLWVPDAGHRTDPRVSPLHAPDLAGLPPALVVTAEHDPIRDGAETYARRLREAGVAVLLRREPSMIHNFLLFDEVSPGAAAAADRVADDLARLLPVDRGAGGPTGS